jgi:predicted RNA-binding Zn-ribbon protein involved in translation (DUF1610 family)
VRIELHTHKRPVYCQGCGQRWIGFQYDPEVGFHCPICSDLIVPAVLCRNFPPMGASTPAKPANDRRK